MLVVVKNYNQYLSLMMTTSRFSNSFITHRLRNYQADQ